MKNNIYRLSLVICMAAASVVACEKKMTNQYFGNGSTPTMKLSATTLAPTPADSMNKILVVSWTNPGMRRIRQRSSIRSRSIPPAVISPRRSVFRSPAPSPIPSPLNRSIPSPWASASPTTSAYNMDVRVISSYPNNNEELMSNTITISYTTYVIPPKVVPPAPLSGRRGLDGTIQCGTPPHGFRLMGTPYIWPPTALTISCLSRQLEESKVAILRLRPYRRRYFNTPSGRPDIPGPSVSGFTILPSTSGPVNLATPIETIGELMYLAELRLGTCNCQRPSLSDTTNGSYQGYVDITNNQRL